MLGLSDSYEEQRQGTKVLIEPSSMSKGLIAAARQGVGTPRWFWETIVELLGIASLIRRIFSSVSPDGHHLTPQMRFSATASPDDPLRVVRRQLMRHNMLSLYVSI